MTIPGVAMSEAPLLERDRELAVFDDLLRGTNGAGPGLVLIEGPAGIGKSGWWTSSSAAPPAAACGS